MHIVSMLSIVNTGENIKPVVAGYQRKEGREKMEDWGLDGRVAKQGGDAVG